MNLEIVGFVQATDKIYLQVAWNIAPNLTMIPIWLLLADNEIAKGILGLSSDNT